MQPSQRKFDITWIKKRKSLRKPPIVSQSVESTSPFLDFDDRVLRAFVGKPDASLHVIDVAKFQGADFDETLKAVLSHVARGELELLKRASVAGDHLVRLTERGRETLNANRDR